MLCVGARAAPASTSYANFLRKADECGEVRRSKHAIRLGT